MSKLKIKTTNRVLLINIFKPSPTGNICTNGPIMVNSGTPSNTKRKISGAFCLMTTNRLNMAKYTGIIKKLAPFNLTARPVHKRSHTAMGMTSKFPVLALLKVL